MRRFGFAVFLRAARESGAGFRRIKAIFLHLSMIFGKINNSRLASVPIYL
jgi:hypothetical protein